LEPDVPPLPADRDKLKQAFLNLLNNSMEAMAAGGKIEITVSASSDMVNIRIADSGPGIPADIDIFQPFATTKNYGTGLGLVIVRQIITAHHGTISYSSQPGKGTIFVISLPRQ
jgi:signal transduction histidine kinase